MSSGSTRSKVCARQLPQLKIVSAALLIGLSVLAGF
jgi:hypothetical protein